MYDKVPDSDGAVPGDSSYSNETNNVTLSIDMTNQNVDSDNSTLDLSNSTLDPSNTKEENELEMSANKENNDDENVSVKSSKKRKLFRSTNHHTFSQVFDSCIEKLIKSNEDIATNLISNQNKIINNILEQQKDMIQQQTQILINNLQTNNVYSSMATNQYSHVQPLRVSSEFSNIIPRFVKVPANLIQPAEKSSFQHVGTGGISSLTSSSKNLK